MSDKKDEHWYNVGKSIGFQEASGLLMKEAQSCFASGMDREAQMLRSIAEKLKHFSDETHPRNNK